MEEILQISEIANNILRYLDYLSVRNLLVLSKSIRKYTILGIKWDQRILYAIFKRNLKMIPNENLSRGKFNRLSLGNRYLDKLEMIVNIMFHLKLPFYYRDDRKVVLGLNLAWINIICNRIRLALQTIREIIFKCIYANKNLAKFLYIDCRGCNFIKYNHSQMESITIGYNLSVNNNLTKWSYKESSYSRTEINDIETFLFLHFLQGEPFSILSEKVEKYTSPFHNLPFNLLNSIICDNRADLYFTSCFGKKLNKNKYVLNENMLFLNKCEKFHINLDEINNTLIIESRQLKKRVLLNFTNKTIIIV